MMLRWMLTNLIREAASRKVAEAVTSATNQSSESPGDSEADVELPPCEIAVVFATNWEAEDFAAKLTNRVTTRCASFVEHTGSMNGVRTVVAETGVGLMAATKATEDLIALHKPKWIVSAGFAGALSPDLRRGHMLMADHVSDVDGNQLAVGFQIAAEVVEANRTLHVGRLVTSQSLLRTPDERLAMGQRHDALAFDMETIAVATVCRKQKVRFLSVRLISDAVEDCLPPEVEKLISQESWATKLGAATGAIFKKPSSVKSWWKFKQQGWQASERLAKFLAGVIPQLDLK